MPAIAIEVDVKGLDELIGHLDLWDPIHLEEAGFAMEESVRVVKDAVRIRTPVGDIVDEGVIGMIGPNRVPLTSPVIPSGNLQGTLKTRTTILLGFLEGSVYTTVPYAPYVEEGHGEILPRRGKFLRFRPKGDVRMVYARRVGPTVGRHMFKLGLLASRPWVIERFKEAMRRAARRMASH